METIIVKINFLKISKKDFLKTSTLKNLEKRLVLLTLKKNKNEQVMKVIKLSILKNLFYHFLKSLYRYRRVLTTAQVN